MLLILLLEDASLQKETVTITSLTGIYIGLGGTVLTSLLALLASWRASNKATITAEKVAALTTQTSRDVAALSAQVTRESATLAARTAQELKDKDYRNDYYKKVLDKRIIAIEYADALTALFRPIKRTDKDEVYHSFFLDENNMSKYEELSDKVIIAALWFNSATYESIRKFNRVIRKALREYSWGTQHEGKKDFLMDVYVSIEEARKEISQHLVADLKNLDDIDYFINNRLATDARD
jgi:hypothetical protein